MADLIETLLTQINLRTQVFHRGHHCGDWQLNLDQQDKVLFHFVSEGNVEVEIEENGILMELSQGDLLLFPKPTKHSLHRSKLIQNEADNIASKTELKPNNNSSELVCAYVEFDPKANNPLFDALPDYVIAKADSHSDNNWLKNLLGLLFAEADSVTTASITVIERLTDILFIHIIRSYLTSCPEKTGILAAYKEPGLRKVLELMHENPQKPWSIADFSAAANLSRSAFIEKFSRTLEMPPMTYLTQQRLEFAYRQLSQRKANILDVALECGYENESSFSKAFKRQYQVSPSLLKKHI